jgi:hypothetical protein
MSDELTLRVDFAKGITIEDGIALLVPYGDTREVLVEIATLYRSAYKKA